MKRRIEVVEYDAAWPGEFEAEASALACVFSGNTTAIHHIGSTAVPGLASKPTIDILVEVEPGTHIPSYGDAMRQLGYECRGECLNATVPGTPGRHYFPKVIGSQHTVHVHVCESGHWQIAELLALRDYLRTHPTEAIEYGALKASLAAQHIHDNVAYMKGKDGLVKEMIGKAIGSSPIGPRTSGSRWQRRSTQPLSKDG